MTRAPQAPARPDATAAADQEPLTASPQPRAASPATFWIQLLVITCLAAGLRLYHLGTPNLWIDELFTVRDAAQLAERIRATPVKAFGYVPTAIGLRLAGVDLASVPPTGYAQWSAMGVDPWSMRIAACVIGIITIPLLAAASRRLLGDRAALLFGLLLAIAPWHVYWSQGARFYSQQFLFAGLALALYLPATDRRPRRWLVAAAVLCAVLAFFSQLTAGVLALIFGVDWVASRLVRQPARLGRAGWIAVGLAAAVCLGALLFELTSRARYWQESFESGTPSRLGMVLGAVYWVEPVVIVAALFSAWALIRRQPRQVLYLLLAAVLPIAVFAVLSMRQYSGTRYTFLCLYGWLGLAALGLSELQSALRPRVGRVLAALPLFLVLAPAAVTLYGYYTYAHAYRERWREALAYVAAHRQDGQIIRCDQVPLGQYYLQDPSILPPVLPQELAQVDRPTWLVVRAALPLAGVSEHWIADFAELRKYFDVVSGRPITSVHVYLYRPPQDIP